MFSRSITTWSTEKIILSAQSHILIPIATRHYKNSYTGGCCNPLYQIKQPRPCYCYCLVCDRKHTWKFNIERCSLSFFRNRRTWSPLAENKPGWTPGPKKTQDFCNDVNYINISILNLLPIQKDMSKCENFLGFSPSWANFHCYAVLPLPEVSASPIAAWSLLHRWNVLKREGIQVEVLRPFGQDMNFEANNLEPQFSTSRAMFEKNLEDKNVRNSKGPFWRIQVEYFRTISLHMLDIHAFAHH